MASAPVLDAEAGAPHAAASLPRGRYTPNVARVLPGPVVFALRASPLLAALAGSVLVRVPAQELPQFPPPVVPSGATIQLTEHVYVIPDGNMLLVPNVGIVVGDDAALVVDTGMGPPNAATVLEELAGVAPGRALFLMATHAHAEHVSGASAFPPDATFVASRALVDALDQLPAEEPFGGMARLSPAIGAMLEDASLRRPDIVFEDEHVLDLGGVRVRLLEMPTHTPTDTVAFVEGDRVLFAGDVVMKERFLSFGPQSTRQAWLDAFERVRALAPETIVPSHGRVADLSDVADQERVLNELHARVRALKSAGETLDATTRTLVAEFEARYPAWRATLPNEIAPIIRSLYSE